MSAITFAPRPARNAFVVVSTEKPRTVVGVHLDNDSAERQAFSYSLNAAIEAGGQGDIVAEVREVPMNIGFAGQAIWGWMNGTVQRFGKFEDAVAEALGVSYGDHALLPNFADEEWAEYGALAKKSSRNPVAVALTARHQEVTSPAAPSSPAKMLFAVLAADGRLVSLIDTDRNASLAVSMFALAASRHPELADHTIRAVYAGANEMVWGDTLPAPTVEGITKELLGEHADGAVFVVPGEWDEYVLRGGKLYTEDGYEADLLTLRSAGLRVQNELDISDAAYAKMERLVARAASF